MRYWTADTHFGHENIIKYCDRPYTSADEMNWDIIERFNSVLTEEDELWLLGDAALGKQMETLEFLTMFNARVYLVAGNHDAIWAGNRKVSPVKAQKYHEVATVFPPNGRAYIGDHVVTFSHFPYENDAIHLEKHGGDKFADYRPKNDGLWLIHGHVHTGWKVKGKQINVGVDVWDFMPVSDAELIAVMDEEA